MAEARALIFSTKGDYIKSYQKDDKSPLKWRGFSYVTIFVRTTVNLGKISSPHAASWDQ